MEQGNFCRLTHQVGDRDSDSEGTDKSLYHNEGGAAASVKVSDEAEQEGYEQCIDGIPFQVFCGGQDDGAVFGKYP